MQDDNDELRRSPGTPVFTAPECCLGRCSLSLIRPREVEDMCICYFIDQCIKALSCFSFTSYAGITYHGRAADTWAVGVTLYCMILGQYPFLGDTLQDTYDKVF